MIVLSKTYWKQCMVLVSKFSDLFGFGKAIFMKFMLVSRTVVPQMLLHKIRKEAVVIGIPYHFCKNRGGLKAFYSFRIQKAGIIPPCGAAIR
ncbi:unnamed protein product [Musa hybrid cultivar]